jgi:putative ABC transport system substrate-binding protein
MKRREFIVGLGGAAAWPLAVRAQQRERMWLIAYLSGRSADDPEERTSLTVFVLGLQHLGWMLGRNARIEERHASGNRDLVRKYAEELVAQRPDLILAYGSGSVGPLQQSTNTIPIVFVRTADPVGGGFVRSLAKPGGNATGFLGYEYVLAGKWVELLKEIAPTVKRVAALRDPSQFAGAGQLGAVQAVAPFFGMEVTAIDLRNVGEMERAIADFCTRAE